MPQQLVPDYTTSQCDILRSTIVTNLAYIETLKSGRNKIIKNSASGIPIDTAGLNAINTSMTQYENEISVCEAEMRKLGCIGTDLTPDLDSNQVILSTSSVRRKFGIDLTLTAPTGTS